MREWTEAILALVATGRPLLGICLGMQWLYEGSDEAPDCAGLGVLSGRCFRLRGSHFDQRRTVEGPHVGWNALDRRRDDAIAEGVPDEAQVYFTHSYRRTGECRRRSPRRATARCSRRSSQRGQIAGVQFHPEKSGDVGLQILRNFMRSAA